MNLPPLRTVRDTTGSPLGESASRHESAAPPLLPPGIRTQVEAARLSPAAREFFLELLRSQLIESTSVPGILQELGDRLPRLISREAFGQALVTVGRLTAYQLARALAGQYHGLLLGNYRVLERIGGGSVGIVFRGEHRWTGVRAAIKVLPVDDTVSPSLIERFSAEVRILARIRHPHVIAVHDAGKVEGSGPEQPTLYYLALELAECDLEHLVYERGTQPPEIACDWGRQVAEGLAAAHEAGLVHRDCKPSNLVLTDEGQIKIVDFGLTREFGSTRTMANMVLGSLDFIAPEQLTDPTTAGPAADIFSLGVTLFWILTGKLPIPSASHPTMALEYLQHHKPAKLREFLPTAPVELEELLSKMMARNPAERPTSRAVAAQLATFSLASSSSELSDRSACAAERRHIAERQETERCRIALLTALEIVIATRPSEPPGHLRRIRSYVRELAAELGRQSEWLRFADLQACDLLARCAALHDLGELLSAPDAPPEGHPLAGEALLDRLAIHHASSLPFLRDLRGVVRNHHEHWDGSGFPDRLAKTAIPPAARITAVAVTYDDLRRGHPFGDEISHSDAVARIVAESGRRFDPAVIEAFRRCEQSWERIYASIPDRESSTAAPPLS